MPDLRRSVLVGAAWLATSGLAVGLTVRAAERDAGDPASCGSLVARGGGCCFEGERFDGAACVGDVVACPGGFELGGGACRRPWRRVRVGGGVVRTGAGDWEATGRVEAREATVSALDVDEHEVTVGEWHGCFGAGACSRALDGAAGVAAAGVSAPEAAAFCAWRGGRLPRDDEWTWWSGGPKMRRYAWGDTGAVCRRGAWGLVQGPCGRGARGPAFVGTHPDGASPEGLLDLAGNVAEWVEAPGGGFRVRGGSFRSTLATELRSWFWREAPPGGRADDVGFRCVYAPAGG